jgi:hypothetical protein
MLDPNHDLCVETAEQTNVPEYLANMVRRAPPPVATVVPRSTPVLAFGDPCRAQVATLGINPSGREFIENGRLLSERRRRLSTLDSLVAESTELLTDAQVRTVIADCAAYFNPERNPYRRWFDPLDNVLSNGLGVSYYDGSACHLDLVQWATNPVWGRLQNRDAKRLLLDETLPHLRNQLRFGSVRLVILNGRQVLTQVEENALTSLKRVGELYSGSISCSLYLGDANGLRFAGWSTNLQSSWGVTPDFRKQLSGWLAKSVSSLGVSLR